MQIHLPILSVQCSESQKFPLPLAIIRYGFITYFCMPQQCFLVLGFDLYKNNTIPIWSLLNFALFTQHYFFSSSVVLSFPWLYNLPCGYTTTLCVCFPFNGRQVCFHCSTVKQCYCKLSWTCHLVNMLKFPLGEVPRNGDAEYKGLKSSI